MRPPETDHRRPSIAEQVAAQEMQAQVNEDGKNLHSGGGWGIVAVILLLLINWVFIRFPGLYEWMVGR